MTRWEIEVPHRQYGEALHDALHLWVTANASLGVSNAMLSQMTVWRDELYRTFMQESS